jgi:hypothetical protein
MISYKMTEECITFFVDGIIVFDCPAARIQQDPAAAFKAMKLLEEIWQRKVEVLTSMKGGETQK